MSTHSTDTRDIEADEGETEQSRANEATKTVARFNENGRLTLLLGGLALAGGLQSRSRSRWLATAGMLAGVGLLAVGLRQRADESGDGSEVADESVSEKTGADETTSDEAHSAMVQGGYEDADENPRDVTEDSNVETGADDGDIQFTTEQDLETGDQPDLEDEAGVEDPRRDDGDVEIDISEAAMADEPSEAAGPSSEQAQPASTEGTEPEPTPDEDTSHMEHDAAASDDEADDREDVETEGGATVHTDTMEAGVTDIDEDDVTDSDDDLNTEPPASERQESSRLDDDTDAEDEE